jgi:hypothetical protein
VFNATHLAFMRLIELIFNQAHDAKAQRLHLPVRELLS